MAGINAPAYADNIQSHLEALLSTADANVIEMLEQRVTWMANIMVDIQHPQRLEFFRFALASYTGGMATLAENVEVVRNGMTQRAWALQDYCPNQALDFHACLTIIRTAYSLVNRPIGAVVGA